MRQFSVPVCYDGKGTLQNRYHCVDELLDCKLPKLAYSHRPFQTKGYITSCILSLCLSLNVITILIFILSVRHTQQEVHWEIAVQRMKDGQDRNDVIAHINWIFLKKMWKYRPRLDEIKGRNDMGLCMNVYVHFLRMEKCFSCCTKSCKNSIFKQTVNIKVCICQLTLLATRAFAPLTQN